MSETRLIHGFHAIIAKLRHAAEDIKEIQLAEGRQDANRTAREISKKGLYNKRRIRLLIERHKRNRCNGCKRLR